MSRDVPEVLVPEPIGRAGLRLLESEAVVLAPWSKDARRGAGRPIEELLPRAQGMIVRLYRVGERELALAPRLKVIAKAGAGVDSIDLEAARRRGVTVTWTPGANAAAVAEHTLGLLLALTRRLAPAHEAVAACRPYAREEFMGVELEGKTLGIAGVGRIGSRVAAKAHGGFGMHILAFDPYVERSRYPDYVRFTESFEELLRASDFVTLHVPLTDETRHMLDGPRLALLRPGARVINTSRGAVIDTAALARALSAGRIAGAALDVFEEEPLPAGHPLRRAPNALFTPHIAGMAEKAIERIAETAARDVLAVLRGEPPRHPVPREGMP